VTSVSSSDQCAEATCEQASSVPLITCPQSADKEGVRGKPSIPNSRSPGTVTSIDPGVGGTSAMMTSQGGLELGPPKASTYVASLKDKGVEGSGQVTERQKIRTPKVCFLFKKTVEVHGLAPRVVGYKEVPHLHMHIGPIAAGSPWYELSGEDAWIPQGRKRASWPWRPMALEPTGHLPPPCGQKPPT
jgi:hypothetical protein